MTEQKPRVWRLTSSPPPEVTRLVNKYGMYFSRDPEDSDGWYKMDTNGEYTLGWYSWTSLLTEFETLTEVL